MIVTSLVSPTTALYSDNSEGVTDYLAARGVNDYLCGVKLLHLNALAVLAFLVGRRLEGGH